MFKPVCRVIPANQRRHMLLARQREKRGGSKAGVGFYGVQGCGPQTLQVAIITYKNTGDRSAPPQVSAGIRSRKTAARAVKRATITIKY